MFPILIFTNFFKDSFKICQKTRITQKIQKSCRINKTAHYLYINEQIHPFPSLGRYNEFTDWLHQR